MKTAHYQRQMTNHDPKFKKRSREGYRRGKPNTVVPFEPPNTKPRLDNESPKLSILPSKPAIQQSNDECNKQGHSSLLQIPSRNEFRLEIDAFERTILHEYLATTPSSLQNLSDVRHLIKKVSTNAMIHRDFRGMTPLHYACSSHSNVKILHEIIQMAPMASNMSDISGNLPLHHYIGCFVQEGSVSAESIQHLHRSNPQAVLTRNKEGDIPLHILCRRWHPDHIGDALLQANSETVKIPDLQGRLPLAIACEWRVNHKLIISMCELYPDAASVKDLYGDVPLHILCRTYPEDIPEKGIFLALAKASPKMIAVPNADGTLPIHTACEWVLATSRVVLLPEERDFFHWPHFLSEYMCSLEILKCFLEATPQVAPAAMKFMCNELKTRKKSEYSHLVTALALEFLVKCSTSFYKQNDINATKPFFQIPNSNVRYQFADRRLLLRAVLSMETTISFEAFNILFGDQWVDMNHLVKQPFSKIDRTLPLHEAARAGELIDSNILKSILDRYPLAAKQRDSRQRLPIDYAVERRLSFDAVKALFHAYPAPVMEPLKKDREKTTSNAPADLQQMKDADMNLAFRAAINDSETQVIMFLLLNNPSVLQMN